MDAASATSSTKEIITTTRISSTVRFYSNETNSTWLNTSYWKLDDLPDDHAYSSPRQTLVTLILYLLCALIALTLLIILFSIIIFTYRNNCRSSSSTKDHRQPLTKGSPNNRIGIQIENTDYDSQTTKTNDSTVRPCF